MASTSSASSVQKRLFKYDVFLSFRGEDVRKTFVDHLYLALVNKGIITYKDDKKIDIGERIDDQLISAIEESRFYIIVFSKNYASSSWCLDELVKIMECQKMTEHTAYPVFFDVEPTEIRHQSGVVGEAFAKHVRGSWSPVLPLPLDCLCSIVASCCRGSSSSLTGLTVDLDEDVERWRKALEEAAGLAGMELKNTFNGHEAEFIQKIVEKVSLKLHFFNSSIDGKLVGMETRVKDVVSSLEIDSDDVRMIGIKGIGGGGKTTLARAVFDHISLWFEGKCFVENVREVSKGSLSGLKKLQKHVLRNALNDQSIVVPSVSDGKSIMKKMMSSKRVLVVLDDVDAIDQLEALAGELTWFKPGSRIIITTRDWQVLVAHGVHVKNIHNVNLLSNEEALCLLRRYAFKRETPNQGYEELSREVVHYAAGLPLIIKVLGSFLYDRTGGEWEDTIKRLKTIPLKEISEILELSYNQLESDQKEIFLDIACILKGQTKEKAIRMLESCGFCGQIGLRVLEQKSMISISRDNDDDDDYDDDDDDDDDDYEVEDSDYFYYGVDIDVFYRLRLHDHIEEMGMNIVRRLHPHEPKRHSRLWIKEEIEDILFNELGTEEIKCIKLKDTGLHPEIIMKGLRKMKELRFLYVKPSNFSCTVDEVSQYLPDSLQSLWWNLYPCPSLPESFQANKLVYLEMAGSEISELWEGREGKVLNNLKFLDLRRSKLRTFDLTVAPRLEKLNLGGCHHLTKLHMPVECPNLKILILCGSKVGNLNLEMTPRIEKLYLGGCHHLTKLHMPVECPNLKILTLCGSKVGNLNLEMTPHLERLDLDACNQFELLMPVECLKLKYLKLKGSKLSNLNLGLTPNLQRLELRKCYCLQEIHASVGCLKNLDRLLLKDCLVFSSFKIDKLDSVASFQIAARFLYECPLHLKTWWPINSFDCKYDESGSSWSGNLEKLISSVSCQCTCKNIEHFSATICDLQCLRELELEGFIPKDLWLLESRLESLEKLFLYDARIQHLPDSICMLKHLKSLTLDNCSDVEQLPEGICRLDCLEELDLRSCGSLRDIPKSICNMKCLRRLYLHSCSKIEKLPEELGFLECLKELDIYGTCISFLPQSIYQLKGLRIIGSRKQLQSYGFTSFIKYTLVSYYVEV